MDEKCNRSCLWRLLSLRCTRQKATKPKSHYNWRSVSHYAKVSSPFWDLWSDITFCPKVVFWNCCLVLLRRPLWREVGSVICLSLSSNLPSFTSNIYVTCVLQFSNLYTISITLQSVPSEYSRLCSASYFSSNILQESRPHFTSLYSPQHGPIVQ
jgi:hypothetical protein